MNIAGLQKLTASDFPGFLACIVFLQGCNLKCPYCQNSSLIPMLQDDANNSLSENEFFEFLEKRKNILEGVVVSGGEPLVHQNVSNFISKIKSMGYKVKLDTNGINYLVLKELLDAKLLDYIAMDIKNDFDNYSKTVGVPNIDTQSIQKSIDYIKSSNIDYEFRTTIVKEFHTLENISNICEIVGKESKLFIQNFEDSSNVMNHELHGFDYEELENIQKHFEKDFPNFHVRGI